MGFAGLGCLETSFVSLSGSGVLVYYGICWVWVAVWSPRGNLGIYQWEYLKFINARPYLPSAERNT